MADGQRPRTYTSPFPFASAVGIALGFLVAVLVARWVQLPTQGSLWAIVTIWLLVGITWERIVVHGLLARRRRRSEP